MSGNEQKDFAKMAEQNEYIKEAYECLEKMSADERKEENTKKDKNFVGS